MQVIAETDNIIISELETLQGGRIISVQEKKSGEFYHNPMVALTTKERQHENWNLAFVGCSLISIIGTVGTFLASKGLVLSHEQAPIATAAATIMWLASFYSLSKSLSTGHDVNTIQDNVNVGQWHYDVN